MKNSRFDIRAMEQESEIVKTMMDSARANDPEFAAVFTKFMDQMSDSQSASRDLIKRCLELDSDENSISFQVRRDPAFSAAAMLVLEQVTSGLPIELQFALSNAHSRLMQSIVTLTIAYLETK